MKSSSSKQQIIHRKLLRSIAMVLILFSGCVMFSGCGSPENRVVEENGDKTFDQIAAEQAAAEDAREDEEES